MEYCLHVKDILSNSQCRLMEEVMFYDKEEWGHGGTFAGPDLRVRHVRQKPFKEEDVDTISKRILFNELSILKNKLQDIYIDKVSPWYFGSESTFNFLSYDGKVKGHYEYHTDHYKLEPRVLTMLIGVNSKDEWEGGKLLVGNDEEGIKLDKGECLMFPSNFMFPHKVAPVESGNRKVLVIWTT